MPEHRLVADGVADTAEGTDKMVSAAVVAVVLPHRFVAVSVYTPAAAVPTVNAAGLRSVDEKPLGPLHEYEVALVAAPVSVNVPPLHIDADDSVAETEVGATVQPMSTVIVADWPVMLAKQPAAEVALSIEYVVVAVGETVTIDVPETPMVVEDDPPPVHE